MWQWFILIFGFIVALVGGWAIARRRKPRPVFYCKQCGHNLMDAPVGQPCPVCGNTERLSKGK